MVMLYFLGAIREKHLCYLCLEIICHIYHYNLSLRLKNRVQMKKFFLFLIIFSG